jgi:hypothetical protein
MVGPGPTQLKKKFPFQKIVIVFRDFFTKFCFVFGWYFYTEKKYKSGIKIPGFRQNFKNTKKFEK